MPQSLNFGSHLEGKLNLLDNKNMVLTYNKNMVLTYNDI